MARKLPPLNALRAFEASARHLSFSRAADELCVTPAAVSQHVKQLESYFGQDLFERRARGGLELTEAGRACIPGIRQAFELLVNSCARIASLADPDRVTLLVSPSLTAKWLVPRLHRFHSAYPRIDVQIWANVTGRFHDPHDHDLAIYYSPGPYPGLETRRIMLESVFPVCSPRLIAGAHPLREPADLRHHVLLHDETMHSVKDFAVRDYPGWAEWLDAVGLPGIDASHGPRIQMSNVVIEAAIEGNGVALGRSCLVLDDLRTGRLVRPFAFDYPTRFGYFLVRQPGAIERRSVAVFHDWLLEEAGATDRALQAADFNGRSAAATDARRWHSSSRD